MIRGPPWGGSFVSVGGAGGVPSITPVGFGGTMGGGVPASCAAAKSGATKSAANICVVIKYFVIIKNNY
jgi:hypothetical protein